MKTPLLLLSLCFFQIIGISDAKGQTLTLQPGPADGMDLRLCSASGYSTSSGSEVMASAWTYQGNSGIDHSFIQFDLSSIPAGATITDAQLFLYGATDLPSGGHSTLSGSNEWLIQRVISSWNLSTTWATSPTATTLNQVSMPATTTVDQDFQANVTNLVQDMVDNPSSSFGFELKLQTEIHYRRVNFASRNYTTASKRPKLVVTYTTTAGLNDERSKLEVRMYPNPVKGTLYLETSKPMNSIQVVNTLGNVIDSKVCATASETIDLSSYSEGIYFVHIMSEGGTAIRKVEVQ
nr:DNRLRE domain-containing protein [uncultured Fluviicola sp.]